MRPILTPLVALAALAPAVTADVLQLSATQDNTVFSEVENSNGAGDHIFAGQNNGNHSRRALLAFDIANQIPAGSTINSVSLRLRCSQTISGSWQVDLNRLLESWGEGASDAIAQEGTGAAAEANDATWNTRFFPGMPWTTPGGEFVSPASASRNVIGDNAFYTWTAAGMTADVQLWLDQPSTDFGWVLKFANETINQNAKRFDSRTNPTVNFRPRLTVDFTPPSTCTSTSFCSSTPNSSGGAALIATTGSCSVATNNFGLVAQPVPNTIGVFFYSAGKVNGGLGTPFGNGLRCIGSAGNPIFRTTPVAISGNTLARQIDFTTLSPAGAITPGSTWNLQAWFRDPPAGGAQFDLSDAVEVTFQ